MSVKSLNRWRIWQKGLVMICVPLASELIFVSLLFLMLLQAQEEIRVEQHTRDLIKETSDLLSAYVNAVTGAVAYRVTRTEADEKLFADSIDGIGRTLNSIDYLTKDDPSEQKQMAEIVHKMNSTLNDCRQIMKRTTPDGLAGLVDLQKTVTKLGTKGNHSVESIDQFLLAQEDIERGGPEVRGRARERIQFVVMAGIALNVFITIFLALYFSTEISGRIKTLIENSLRFPASKPLLPMLQGSDELSDFDHTFRATVVRIKEAESFKNQLVGVISHELRTPLTSISAIISLVLAAGKEELEPSVIERLEKVDSNVSEVMSLVNDLLDIERMEAGKFPLRYQTVKVSLLLESSVKPASKAAEDKQIMLVIQSYEGNLEIDTDQMSKALTKMILHCLEHSNSSGTIKLEAHERNETVLITLSSDRLPSENPSEQMQMFDKLRSLKYSTEARFSDKLGLALCRAIVTQHGGSVGVDAENNGYWIKLPKLHEATRERKTG